MNKQHTILVSDDNADIRTLLADVLEDEGYLVRNLHPVTLQEIRHTQASLVILELLPTTADDTILLIDQLRSDDATRRLPILLSSTSDFLFDRLAEPLQHLRCEMLIKPFAIEQLLNVIARALGQPPVSEAGGCMVEQTCPPQ